MKRIISLILVILIFGACSKDELWNNGDNANMTNQQPTGTSANDLLSDTTFTSMVIEVVYVEGFAPSQTTLDGFLSFLESRTFKPNGITFETRAISSPGNGPYSNAEIVAIEDANRTKFNTVNRIAVWAFFADSESESNTSSGVILGTAYRNTSFVIYEETIHDLSNSIYEPNRSVVEMTVINHEFGHILGLTNLGSALQSSHEDAEHIKHCNVETCLMYWTAETGFGLDNLMGGSVPQLDAQCIADLQANGGK